MADKEPEAADGDAEGKPGDADPGESGSIDEGHSDDAGPATGTSDRRSKGKGKGEKAKGDKAKGDRGRADKKDNEKDYEFKVPKFDEDAFIHKELTGFHTTSILFVWGILAAIGGWILFRAMGPGQSTWYAAILLAALFGIALKWLFPALRADISHYKRREWLGTGFLFFFTWLAFMILLLNPPVSDFAPPAVDAYVNPPVQQTDQMLAIDVFWSDNDAVRDHDFTITRGGTALDDAFALERIDRGHHRFIATGLPPGSYAYSVTAHDDAGHEATVNGSFRISANAMQIDLPDNNLLDDRIDTLLVTVAPEVDLRAVYLAMTDRDARVYLQYDETLGGWKGTANFAGWQEGDNTFSVVAEMQNQFHGSTRVDGGVLTLAGPYTLDVTAQIGDFTPKVVPEKTTAPPRAVPGLEAVAAVAVLGAGAIVVRRRA